MKTVALHCSGAAAPLRAALGWRLFHLLGMRLLTATCCMTSHKLSILHFWAESSPVPAPSSLPLLRAGSTRGGICVSSFGRSLEACGPACSWVSEGKGRPGRDQRLRAVQASWLFKHCLGVNTVQFYTMGRGPDMPPLPGPPLQPPPPPTLQAAPCCWPSLPRLCARSKARACSSWPRWAWTPPGWMQPPPPMPAPSSCAPRPPTPTASPAPTPAATCCPLWCWRTCSWCLATSLTRPAGPLTSLPATRSGRPARCGALGGQGRRRLPRG